MRIVLQHVDTSGELPAQLEEDTVLVCLYCLDAADEERAALEGLLSAEERARAARFRFDQHRQRFVTRCGMLRRILARLLQREPAEIRFGVGPHGKPFVASPGELGALGFNASNSHGLGAMAVTRRFEIGLDLERVCSAEESPLAAAQEFAPEERERLLELPEGRRLEQFFALWTCKEAYLKGTGLGLNAPLNGFAIGEAGSRHPRLLWSKINARHAESWSFHRLSVQRGYHACLAVGDVQSVAMPERAAATEIHL